MKMNAAMGVGFASPAFGHKVKPVYVGKILDELNIKSDLEAKRFLAKQAIKGHAANPFKGVYA